MGSYITLNVFFLLIKIIFLSKLRGRYHHLVRVLYLEVFNEFWSIFTSFLKNLRFGLQVLMKTINLNKISSLYYFLNYNNLRYFAGLSQIDSNLSNRSSKVIWNESDFGLEFILILLTTNLKNPISDFIICISNPRW